MISDNDVLKFFREEISTLATITFKKIPLELDTALQSYSEIDELIYAIEKYDEKFNVNTSDIDMNHYYPWKDEWFFRKWFTRKPVRQSSKPLTVRMFAESARAGKWLYD
ncbi:MULTISPECIES: DUF1493 family protein [Erwinia]|uniref:DUF1493 family protein n=1 Tax=Erwinia TaxID=551 RepID=UPI0005589FC6|nr:MULTISPECIES: DUF1493 family protein [Erwinia]